MMIDSAWNEYRGWAARARELQKSSQIWNRAALISATAAAILGAAASQTAGISMIGKPLSLLAAIAAGLTPILGKEILALGSEAKWIRARAIAEAIKSECFRVAARAGDYAGPDAEANFAKRLETLTSDAVQVNLTPRRDPVTGQGDQRRPTDHLDADWYIANRLDHQIAYYGDKQRDHERAVARLRYVAFGASAAAALFGVAGVANQQLFAPWIGALMTMTTAVAAYGLLDRRQYLAASFGAMTTSLDRIKARAGSLALADLVTYAEDRMQSEHAAWTERMTQTIPAPTQTGAPEAKAVTNKTGTIVLL